MFSIVKKATPSFPAYQIIMLENKLKEIEYSLCEEWSDKDKLTQEKIKYTLIINIIKCNFQEKISQYY